jgi:MoaA/NifB/PqqE/SkfB family radical SAM enzyme
MLNLGKQKLEIPEKLNVYLITGYECNCRCKYCVGCPEECKNKIINEKEYYEKLENVLKKLKKHLWSITILGGEPTISPRIFGIFDIIKKYSFKKVLTTNGIMLKNSEFLNKLNDSSLDHLNISRHCITDKGNGISFGNKNIPSLKELGIIVDSLNSGIKVRINCNLIKGHIDSFEKLKKFIKQIKSVGIYEISFSELAKMDKDYIVPKNVIDFCNENRVLIYDILKKIRKDKNFKIIKEEVKEDYGSFVMHAIYDGVNFEIRTVNTSLKEKQLAIHKNKIYSLKFHPNGVLSASWDSEKYKIIQ